MVFELQASRKARIIAVVLLLTLLYALWIALNSHLRGGLVSVTGALILSVVFYFWLAPAHSIGTLRIAADRCYIGEKIIGALVSSVVGTQYLRLRFFDGRRYRDVFVFPDSVSREEYKTLIRYLKFGHDWHPAPDTILDV
jgi:hypothetical protein